ncbi:MAG: hypothetical protein R3C11_00550 [Planctomycetaceae bacterium]
MNELEKPELDWHNCQGGEIAQGLFLKLPQKSAELQTLLGCGPV